MTNTVVALAGQSTTPSRRPRPSWQEMTWKFPDERDCLASFLVLEAAEVLSGVKPANLVQLRNRPQPCGRNLHLLWQEHAVALLAESPLEALPLRCRDSGDLMLFYSPELLQIHLQHPEREAFLRQQGYQSVNLKDALSELKRRFQASTEMPHEIGLFLGYPLKDVAGFMGCSDKPCTACRMWRIYGDPEPSLALSDRYADCRRDMADQLNDALDPASLLRNTADTPKPACFQ